MLGLDKGRSISALHLLTGHPQPLFSKVSKVNIINHVIGVQIILAARTGIGKPQLHHFYKVGRINNIILIEVRCVVGSLITILIRPHIYSFPIITVTVKNSKVLIDVPVAGVIPGGVACVDTR